MLHLNCYNYGTAKHQAEAGVFTLTGAIAAYLLQKPNFVGVEAFS